MDYLQNYSQKMKEIHEKTQIGTRNNTKTFLRLLISCIFVFCFVWFSVLPVRAQTATLYLLPSTGNYTVGTTFSVVVKVSSGGVPINAAEGSLIFNTEELNVVSLSKSGSIFTLWTTEPTFSNSAGTIEFGGGTPTSFTGAAGTIVTITFKAKKSASANVNFLSGSVLAADGKGTNVLANMAGGTYTLKPGIVTPPAEEVPPEEYVPPPTVGAPAAPVIFSLTNSNPDKWYSNNDPEFNWKLPSDATGVSLLLHKSPTANPGPVSDGLMESKKYDDVEDGIWYFHIKFRNQYGWGAITHRKVLIDTQAPKPFAIKVDNEGDPTNPSPILHFDTTDALSGIEYYEVKIGEAEPVPITTAYLKENPYQMPSQAPGKHTVLVKASDAADNFTIATTDVTIEAIAAPTIIDFPQTPRAGDILTIKGTSKYPDGKITVFVKKEGEEVITKDVKTDSQGNWLFVYDKSLDKGTYQVWAVATDSRGAKSNPTEKITLAATLPTLLKFGTIAIGYLTVMATLIVLIVVAVGIIFYTWYRISLWRKRVRAETKEVAQAVLAAFKALREEVEEQIEYLDGKPGLTKSEREVRNKLKEALDVSEQFIGKELKDVEKELE